jgi:hypothetical protein
MDMAWEPDEKLCKLLCTHLVEETEPNDVNDISDFAKRWNANKRHHCILVTREKLGDFFLIEKFKNGKREMQIVLDTQHGTKEVPILFFRLPSYLKTIKDSYDSLRVAESLNIEVIEIQTWLKVEKIE